MKERKNVTWRVAENSESKKINKWLDEQKNIQVSLANIVLHMIDRYGYINITDYQVQKQLYGKITDIPEPIESEEEHNKDSSTEKENSQSTNKVDEKDIYDDVNLDNI